MKDALNLAFHYYENRKPGMDGNDQEYGFPEHLIYSIVYLQDEIIDWAKERDPHLIIALVLNNIEYLKTLQTKNKSGEEVKDPQK